MSTQEPFENAVPVNAGHVDLPDFVLIFEGEEGREHAFEAIDNDHAIGLMQKEYPKGAWTLYRIENSQRIKIYSYPENPEGE